MGRLFGTDGIRGIANTEITCELAMKLGITAASVLRGRCFLMGTDSRPSADMLASAMAAGLCAAGADVLHAGIIPTPAVAYLTRKYGCDAGIVISASHNPPEYNGIKFFSKDGLKLSDSLESRMESLLSVKSPSLPQNTGRISHIHTAAVKDYLDSLRDAAEAALKGLRIAVDCANGAAAVTAGELFRSLGANVQLLNCDTRSGNINVNCGATDMARLREFVIAENLDAGIAFDGDADRCLLTDENGNMVDGDMILAICAHDMQKQGKLTPGEIVGTVMSNLGLVRFCAANGIRFEATRVGDRYVLDKMLEDSCSLGGEQSGHIIFLDHSTTGDGQLTALKLLSIMKRSGERLSSLAGIMKKYPQLLVNIPVSSEGMRRFRESTEISRVTESAKTVLGDSGRLLIRPSGTEPLIRIMAEGEDEELIRTVIDDIVQKFRNIL